MNAARRSIRRRDWPRGLYEVRPGYFVWRAPEGYVREHPETPKQLTIGYVDLLNAKDQAIEANRIIAGRKPTVADVLTGKTHTIAQLVEKMPAHENPRTAKTMRSIDKLLVSLLGDKVCAHLTVADCAEALEEVFESGREAMAGALRTRLVAVCRRGIALGWLTSNPAEITELEAPTVKRGRLTFETFNRVLAAATEPWLRIAMLLALVTGQDRRTVAAMKRRDIQDLDGSRMLVCVRSKTRQTNLPVAIDLTLRLDVLGMSLADVIAEAGRTRIATQYLVHHVANYGPNAERGSAVRLDTITEAFTQARKAAGIPDVGADGKLAPTFHEIRSLSKRLYDKQGNVNTKELLGHASDSAAAIYADARGVEFQYVKVRART